MILKLPDAGHLRRRPFRLERGLPDRRGLVTQYNPTRKEQIARMEYNDMYGDRVVNFRDGLERTIKNHSEYECFIPRRAP